MIKSVIFKLNSWRDRNFLFLVTAVAALFGLIFGYSIGAIASAILFVDDSFHLSHFMNGLIVCSILLGAWIGAFCGGRLADQYGRRRLIIIGNLLFILINLGIYFVPNLWLLTGYRFLLGIIIGISSLVVPLYIMEILPLRYSSRVIGLNQLFTSIGIAIAYIAGYFFSYTRDWRLMLSSVSGMAILLFLGILILPESPRWLLLRGREGDAWRILCRIRNSFEIDAELTEIKNSTEESRRDWKVLLKDWLWPAVLIGASLIILRQFSGINLFFYYAPTIFEMAGFQVESSAILATSFLGIIYVISTVAALSLLGRYGRRQLLLSGVGGIIISWLFFGLSFLFVSDLHLLRWLILISFVLYILSFSISLGMVVFVMLYELFPLRIRGIVSSMAISLSWLSNVVVTFSFLPLVQVLKKDFFMVYLLICVVGWLFIYFLVPETKGISSERIEANLRAGKKGVALVE